jgi:hypothetical protein
MDPLLTTERAAEKLTELGVKRSPATLRKLRCLGGGPPYRVFSGRPYYTEADLAAWIEGGLSPPRCNSSEPGAPCAGSTGSISNGQQIPRD